MEISVNISKIIFVHLVNDFREVYNMIKWWYNKKNKNRIIMKVKPLHIIDRFILLFQGYSGFFDTVMKKKFEKG